MHSFIISHMSVVNFVYGLAFFALGLSLALQSQKNSHFALSKSLWMLAGFALAHSWVEWAKAYVPLQFRADQFWGYSAYHITEALLVTTSFVFLFLFGINLLIDSIKRSYKFKYVPLIMASIWLIKFVLWDLVIAGVDDIGNWFYLSTSAARYFLAFPGSLITAAALFIQAKTLRGFDLNSAARNCQIAGAAFFLYGGFSGLVVLPLNFWPGNFLNTDTFFDTVGLPVQMFRALLGLVMAFTMIRITNIFDKEQNQRLARAKQQSILIQERERFGRDLHDGAMQSIYSVGLILQTSRLMLQRGETETLEAHLADSQDKLNKAMTLLRNYIGDLNQENKEGLGLEELLKNSGEEFRGLSMLNLKINSSLEKDIILTPKQVNYINHIIKEALFNIVKHAHASQVEIQVIKEAEVDQKNVKVIIIDDGAGFDPAAVKNLQSAAKNQGLTNMKFRARQLNGRLDVISSQYKGTKVVLTFPYN